MFPWHDRSGRVSVLKSVIFVSLFAPGAWTAWGLMAGTLGSRPILEAIHQTGLWTIRLLFLSLAVTPANTSVRVARSRNEAAGNKETRP